MRRRLASLFAASFAAVACWLSMGCTVETRPQPATAIAAPAVVASQVVVPTPVDPMAAYAGVYTIQGSPVADGCAGGVYLAARTVTVDAAARTIHADVVDRTYAARVEGGNLVGEGRFVPDTACPGSTIFERFTFSLSQEGLLQGVLQSLWLLPPDCSTPCEVQFHIAAQRVQ